MAERGRPTTFDQAQADRLCELMAEGYSLRRACATMRDQHGDTWPTESSVRGWALYNVHDFAAQYTRAREMQAHTLAEEIRDISDTPCLGVKTKTTDEGKVETTEGDMIEHRRLQVDARKWYLSKVLPKVYGERIQQDIKAEVTEAVDKEDLARRVIFLLAARVSPK